MAHLAVQGELSHSRRLDEVVASSALRSRPRRGPLVRRALLTADLVALGAAFAIVQRVAPGADRSLDAGGDLVVFLAALPLWILAARLNGLYARDLRRVNHSTAEEPAPVLQTVSVGVCGFAAIAAITGLASVEPVQLTILWTLATAFVLAARAVARASFRRHPAYGQRTLIVGADAVAASVAQRMARHPEYGLDIVGFVDAAATRRDDGRSPLHVVGSLTELPRLVRDLDVDRVVFTSSGEQAEALLEAVRRVRELDVQADVVPHLCEMLPTNAELHAVEGLPLIGLRPARLSPSDRTVKRLLDVVVSAGSLVLLAPAFVAIAIAIRIDSRGPIFFTQLRMGAGERPFRIFKFRTMVDDAEARKAEVLALNIYAEVGDDRMFKVDDDPRVTRVGCLLRRTSLDELPQLINVLLGQMSLVGPRPLVLDEDRHVAGWGRTRLALRPGITGPWQALGRNTIPFDEMVRLDYHYVTGWSLATDLELLRRTIPAVARARRAY